ncbi:MULTISPECIES: MurR/RpiR family transcriptional regulator [unclassified Lacticaseibacillus]|uniref:MurR/RpiR family transcriptional regulator n=1 Tax=unclassified Lacticaseibacillus TaxID=2759744 RepID=UPI001942B1E0|nr:MULTISPECIES: MurR/RpiR family transcriptional regulator [unclassified Lacticaseibacillus]
MLFLDHAVELSDIDLAIYKYVLQNLDKVIYMRIRELAANTHTSTASVQRFCRKFECQGFTEFKIRLKLLQEQTAAQTRPTPVDPGMYINFFNRVTTPDFDAKIQAAVQLLKQCELVLFIGVGSSNVMAEYGALYFSSLFHMAVRIEDPVTYPQRYFPKALLDKTCVIALSVSGETPEVISYLSNLSFRDSHTLSITNSAHSTVARLTDVNIATDIAKEHYVEQDVTSQVPCLFILEYLAKILHEQTTAK